jgi:hypothetical protein
MLGPMDVVELARVPFIVKMSTVTSPNVRRVFMSRIGEQLFTIYRPKIATKSKVPGENTSLSICKFVEILQFLCTMSWQSRTKPWDENHTIEKLIGRRRGLMRPIILFHLSLLHMVRLNHTLAIQPSIRMQEAEWLLACAGKVSNAASLA